MLSKHKEGANMQQHETNSKFVKHMACENCGSSDANTLYDDGHTHCFSCHTTVGANQDMQAEQMQFTCNKEYNIQLRPSP